MQLRDTSNTVADLTAERPLVEGGVASVADSIFDLVRTVRRAKARLSAASGDDVESVTQLLLRTIAADGPMRASVLATSVGSDLSTVSRQVAVLARRGLLERQADQADGRASLLVVTDAGRAIIAEHEAGRQQFFEDLLSGWTGEELEQFASHLRRFTTSYDEQIAAWTRTISTDEPTDPPSQLRKTTS